MIEFKSVEVTNFLSFGNNTTVFDLTSNESILILGRNEDVGDNGNARNAAGKTSSIQAILFALYGKGLEPKLKADEFVNLKNGKKLVVKLVFTKAGKEYTIIRKRKPSSLDLLIDGEASTLDSMKNTDQIIESIIGMSYSIFMSTFVMTPHIDSFLAMSSSEQRSLIEAMLSMDILSERSESLKLIRKDLEVDVKVYERDIQNAQQVNSRVDENVARIEQKLSKFDEHTQQSIEKIERKLSQNINTAHMRVALAEKETNDKLVMEADQRFLVAEKHASILLTNIKSTNREIEILEQVAVEIEDSKRMSATYVDDVNTELSKYVVTENIEDLEEDVGVLKHLITQMGLRDVTKKELTQLTKDITHATETCTEKQLQLEQLKDGKCHVCGGDYCDESKAALLRTQINTLTSNIADMTQKQEAKQYQYESICVYVDGCLTDLEMKEQDIIEYHDDLVAKVSSLKLKKAKYDVIVKKLESNPHIERYESLMQKHPNITESINNMKQYVTESRTEYNDTSVMADEAKAQLTELSAKKWDILTQFNISTSRDIDRIELDIKTAKDELVELQNSTNPYIEELTEAEKGRINTDTISEILVNIQKDIENIGYLIKLLTSNNSFIRKSILDLYIPFLNKKIYEYTEKLGLSHTVTINNDLSSDIMYMGKQVSYFNMSQGERLRVNLSMSMAFRDLISSLGKNCNLTLVDEMLDAGADTALVNRAVSLLQAKGGHRVIISHREDIKDMVDRTSTIVKRNGFSFAE